MTTLSTATDSQALCVCSAGTYSDTSGGNETCSICPEVGLNCSYAGVRLDTLPLLADFWRSSSSAKEVRRCYIDGACTGGTNFSSYCDGTMYTGPFCDVCVGGHNKASDGTCASCDGWKVPDGIVIHPFISRDLCILVL